MIYFDCDVMYYYVSDVMPVNVTCVKGALDIFFFFFEFSFWLNFIYQVKIDYLFTNTKEKFKLSSKSEEIINFC